VPRALLAHSRQANPADCLRIKDVLDLCLSCRGCRGGCPASVDPATPKAEFRQHWRIAHRALLRIRAIANCAPPMRLTIAFAPVFNFLPGHTMTSGIVQSVLGPVAGRSQCREAMIGRFRTLLTTDACESNFATR
jgi:Fe-S oxidoreductase